ncbi:hypothetical protein BS650_02510 [Aeromonas hydrophila]|nr:hypothetical protein AS145_11110 [Aeromonas hydrophila]ALZ80069.1 hypothetical protein AhyD4_10900 [Aeromonas hydrophila]ANS00053.1 hypothetical protein A9258_10660 [Aeromonas hydrophila]KYQ12515.1 hypothetical protein AW872_07470 [Aeromonas hydrophila]KYQ15058.1 hypothetical protein AW873_07485 [Aeromonas hydrophila]
MFFGKFFAHVIFGVGIIIQNTNLMDIISMDILIRFCLNIYMFGINEKSIGAKIIFKRFRCDS